MRLDSLQRHDPGPSEHAGVLQGRASAAGFCSGAAIFLGAFLSFELQLIVAKALLPRFGGAPAVWTTCMLFFQALLLAGYAYAHGATRALAPRAQGLLQLVLLALALLGLPPAPLGPMGPAPACSTPVLAILALLARSVALPGFLLCASSPLLQAWAARARGSSPYRLYALSNAGSLLGLLAYPLVVEPWLTRRAQERAWSLAFAAFALLSAACARSLWSAAPLPTPVASGAQAEPGCERGPSWRQRLTWLALPACASTLLLAVTNQLCQEVAVVPLLWVLPLGLYLLSFVLTFASERAYARSWCFPVLVLGLALMAQAVALGAHAGILYAVPVLSLGLFVCCLFCHGELAARRPAPRHLTSFYLMVALGGALGGVFVGLIAPLVFRAFDELYVGLCACGALAAAFGLADPAYRARGRAALNPVVPALGVVAAVIGLLLGARVLLPAASGLEERRDFYGTLRIGELPAPDGAGFVRYLTHGGTRHGQQFLSPERRAWPTTYYGHASGIGILLDELAAGPPLQVGVVGLGAGILASYGRAGDRYTFYELSPSVIDVAEHEFSFLADSRAELALVPGDARLALERASAARFDVLVLDAFSSDAIPVHLLTREAFELYERRLTAGGVLALHVTTRHLDLGPLVAALARELEQPAWEIASPADDARGTLGARWILVPRERELLARPRIRSAGRALAAGNAPRPWTDDYSNLLQVLR